jgi:hypothetical protein
MPISNKKETTAQLIDKVWATLGEVAESQKRAEKWMEEFREDMKKSREEFDLSMKKSSEEFDRRIEKINGNMGSWDNNIGNFAEEYFQNSFDKGKKNFFGEHFYKLERNLLGIKPKFEDEYDIVLINGKYVGIIEVKFKGHVNNIPKILKKVETFKENFPYYGDRKIYLGLASMSFYKELEEKCKSEGIAIIKQVGDNIIITDEHLKAY